jgi:hypothetical protein
LEKRIEWDNLPATLKEAISARTGPVISGQAATNGQNSPLAAVLNTRNGKVFVKGLPSGHRLVVTQAREAAAAPLAQGLSPQLLWQFDEAGWNVNGFEHIDGRKASYRPGSPDIGPVTDLMTALCRIEIPPGPGPWKPIATRLRTYVDDPADGLIFAGRNLTHTDWMPDNVLLSGGRAWLVRPHHHRSRSHRRPSARIRRRRPRARRRIRPRQPHDVGRDRKRKPDPVGQDDGTRRPHLGTAPERRRLICAELTAIHRAETTESARPFDLADSGYGLRRSVLNSRLVLSCVLSTPSRTQSYETLSTSCAARALS